LFVAAIGVTVWIVRVAVGNASTTFSGVVQPVNRVDMNFKNVAVVTELSVKPGDKVQAGEVLAKQDDVAARLAAGADNAAVAADQSRVQALQAPTISTAQQQDFGLRVQQAQQQLGIAQQGLSTASTSGPATTLDQRVAAAQDSIAQAQTQVALAENAQAVATSPASSAEIAAAQSQLAKDQAQLATDQQLVADTTITAPISGTVGSVNGAVGDVVGNSGVRSYSSQPGVVPNPPSFQLFPGAPQQPQANNQAASYAPLVSVYDTSGWEVVAQVPESDVMRLNPGHRATIDVSALGGSVPATVQRVQPVPVQVNGKVNYDAIVIPTGKSRRNPMPGMTADVVLK
jgi:multidrug efflux pump subunit AcrA (membrane-fusion protein)